MNDLLLGNVAACSAAPGVRRFDNPLGEPKFPAVTLFFVSLNDLASAGSAGDPTSISPWQIESGRTMRGIESI